MNTSTFFSPLHTQESPDSSLRTLDLRRQRNALTKAQQAIRGYFIGDAETAVSGSVPPFYAFVRTWTPLLVPLLVGTLSLAIALMLTRSGLGQMDRVTVARIPLVFLLFLGGGAVFGCTLHTADDDVTRLATVVAGSGIFLAALLSVVSGVLVGIGTIAACAALLVWYVWAHVYKVAPAAIAVTHRFNRYLRTLPPGLHIRLPGERIAATFETWEHRFMSPTETVEVESRDGLLYRACAVAMVSYAVDPGQASRTWQRLNTWERDLQDSVSPVLLDSLTRWTMRIVAEENVPQDELEQEILTKVRVQAEVLGVLVKSVRIRNIQLESLNMSAGSWGRHLLYWAAAEMGTPVMYDTPTITNHPLPAEPGPEAASEHEPPHSPQTAHSEQAESSPHAGEPHEPTIAPVSSASDAFERTSAGAKDKDKAINSEQLPPMRIAPDTLADTYQAIRERHITDPATIRLVARAFTHVSQDPDLNAQTPYNAAAAARILDDYAARLEQREAQRSRSLVSAR